MVEFAKGYYGSPRISNEYMDCALPMSFDQYSYCKGHSCEYCFVVGTPIMMADGTNKNIEDVKKEDVVITFNTLEKTLEKGNVTSIGNRKSKTIYTIKLYNKKVLRTTPEHPFLTRCGWIKCKDLKEKDEVLQIDGHLSNLSKGNGGSYKYSSKDASHNNKEVQREVSKCNDIIKSANRKDYGNGVFEKRLQTSRFIFENENKQSNEKEKKQRNCFKSYVETYERESKRSRLSEISQSDNEGTMEGSNIQRGDEKSCWLEEGSRKEESMDGKNLEESYLEKEVVSKHTTKSEFIGTYNRQFIEGSQTTIQVCGGCQSLGSGNGFWMCEESRFCSHRLSEGEESDIISRKLLALSGERREGAEGLFKLRMESVNNLATRIGERGRESVGEVKRFCRWIKIRSIEVKNEVVDVYNFEVEPNNNYVANGIVVHNCFSDFFKKNNPAYEAILDEDGKVIDRIIPLKKVNVDRIKKVFRGEVPDNPYYQHFVKNKFPLQWGSLADPFDATEKKAGVGLELIKFFAEINYPVIFSTKGAYISEGEYHKVFKKASSNKNFAFQFSIVTNSDEISKKIEPGVSMTSKRLEGMKAMSELGYWTILRLRPYIVGITNIEIDNLIERASKCGAKALSMEFFCVEMRLSGKMLERYKRISKILGFDMVEYYKVLSPMQRGTYRRLNRDLKEGYVKRVYKACTRNGLQFNVSDPDFKELNGSGCCCGLSDEQYGNSDLHRWSRAQLTNSLVNLRKRYWSGGSKLLHWEEVINNGSNTTFLDEKRFYGDSLKCFGGEHIPRRDLTFGLEFQQVWNNLRSPSNPYRYFHGILEPNGMDENKNIVYKYVPQDYERRWMKEDILDKGDIVEIVEVISDDLVEEKEKQVVVKGETYFDNKSGTFKIR